MKNMKLLTFILLVMTATGLFADTKAVDDKNTRRLKFNLSGGYTFSVLTGGHRPVYDNNLLNGINLNISMVNYHKNSKVLFEPGFSYHVLWGGADYTHVLWSGDDYTTDFQYIDFFCKFKYNTNPMNLVKENKNYPYIGLVGSLFINEQHYDKFAELLSFGLVVGNDTVMKDKITLGLKYNLIFDREVCGLGLQRHLFKVMVGYLF